LSIIGAFDIHRGQLTYEYVDSRTGEVNRGRIAPADRQHLRAWLAQFKRRRNVHFAMEGCTGWRYVAEEVSRIGGHAHVADPADAAALRGRKRRAKTDRTDSTHLRELLVSGRVPESWIPPEVVLEARAKVRLYRDLSEERTRWIQRVHASLFHLGVPAIAGGLSKAAGREAIETADLSPAVAQAVRVGVEAMDQRAGQLAALRAELVGIGNRQPACLALHRGLFGVGPLSAVFFWAEMGDARRFTSSDDAVRHAGLDITVHASDDHRAAGHLARQGPAALRWALYEAAKNASRSASPDHAYYLQARARLGANRATLSVARKLARRVHHILRAAGDDVLAGWDPRRSPSERPELWDGTSASLPPHRGDVRPAPVRMQSGITFCGGCTTSKERRGRASSVGTTPPSTITSPKPTTALEHPAKPGRAPRTDPNPASTRQKERNIDKSRSPRQPQAPPVVHAPTQTAGQP
jgi:transposase